MQPLDYFSTWEGNHAAFRRSTGQRKSSNEAMRFPKRRLSDAVYRVTIDDLAATTRMDPGGQQGNDSGFSATGSFGQATPRTRHTQA